LEVAAVLLGLKKVPPTVSPLVTSEDESAAALRARASLSFPVLPALPLPFEPFAPLPPVALAICTGGEEANAVPLAATGLADFLSRGETFDGFDGAFAVCTLLVAPKPADSLVPDFATGLG
jgi:hypothetical protein